MGLVTPVFFDFTIDGDGFSDSDVAADRGGGGASKDVDTLRCANVLVGGWVAEPEPRWADGSYDTSDIGDGRVDERRIEACALDLGNGGCGYGGREEE